MNLRASNGGGMPRSASLAPLEGSVAALMVGGKACVTTWELWPTPCWNWCVLAPKRARDLTLPFENSAFRIHDKQPPRHAQ